jgi:hypothetical protein
MLKKYCIDTGQPWDKGLPLVLFAIREVSQTSLGFSPNELIFGHKLRGPLQVLKEIWVEEGKPDSLVEYVTEFRERLQSMCKLAKENLEQAQVEMKSWYDKKAQTRTFEVGEKVLVLLPMPGSVFQASFSGPYEVIKKISDLDYIVRTPDRRKKTQTCHINMLKAYKGEGQVHEVLVSVPPVPLELEDMDYIDSEEMEQDPICTGRLRNSEVLNNLDSKLGHLPSEQARSLKDLILRYEHICSDIPTQTTVCEHDVEVGDALPIKQNYYKASPDKRKAMGRRLHI